jgi:ferritin
MNTIIQVLNEQLTMERQNAAIYDALSAALDVVNWAGSAAWMKKSANEEREHADKITAYIIDRFGVPVFAALEGCQCPSGDNLVDYFEAALQRERQTTEAIRTLNYIAEEAEDCQTEAFLIWFLEEQTKSEREISDLLLLLRRLDKTGFLLFDKELK